MDPGQRQAISEAAAFYGQPRGLGETYCVVTNASDPQWHHLDEANPRWWHYVNIVPLNGDLNQKLDKRRYRGLPVQLQAATLELTARDHFRRGRFAHGYACARLGAYLARPARHDIALGEEENPDRALVFSSLALLNLRPISAVPFAVDTIKRSILPILASADTIQLRNESLARLVIELGSYFRDYGLARDASRCCDLAGHLLQGVDTVEGQELRTRVMQHRGIAVSALGQSEFAHELLDRSNEAIAEHGSYIEGRANYALWKARFLLNAPHPDVDRCRELVKEVYDLQSRHQASVWTYAETVWTDAESHLIAGKRKPALDIVTLGDELFKGAGIVPTAIMAPSSVREFREKFPRDLYAVPRDASTLGGLAQLARDVVNIIEERFRSADESG